MNKTASNNATEKKERESSQNEKKHTSHEKLGSLCTKLVCCKSTKQKQHLNTKAPYIRNSNPNFFFGFPYCARYYSYYCYYFSFGFVAVPNALRFGVCTFRLVTNVLLHRTLSLFWHQFLHSANKQVSLFMPFVSSVQYSIFGLSVIYQYGLRLHRIKAIFCHLILSSTFLHFFGFFLLTSVVPLSSLCIHNMIFGGCLFCIPLHEFILYIILSSHINVSKLISRHKS